MRNSGKSDSFVEIPKAPTEVYSEGAFSGIKYYFRVALKILNDFTAFAGIFVANLL